MNNNWLEEAKKSRTIMFSRWNEQGRPMGDFYKWLLDHVENGIHRHERKQSAQMDKAFERTIE